MFGFPGFDPKTFTNDELFEKQVELARRRVIAHRFGKPEIAQQFQMMIQAIENERRERMFEDRIGVALRNSSPVSVDTDPMPDEEPQQTTKEKVKDTGRPFKRPVRSSKPVLPNKDGTS